MYVCMHLHLHTHTHTFTHTWTHVPHYVISTSELPTCDHALGGIQLDGLTCVPFMLEWGTDLGSLFVSPENEISVYILLLAAVRVSLP
jgi:hypothetical protein